ncbi:uncharacterized protein LOC118411259 [Branchiostoma floridae]|uniref:Uncharacterized protein LOC118411259 n=1 Tax=Branchiostoma floridae TaxID=7739 RepID=A0A9J7MJ43_BRAFL|nr:uncharacterized protein LOC118411259 [Branchiostoma floridae]
MAFSGPVFCFLIVVLAGNSVNGFCSSSGSKGEECFAAVEAVRTYLMKDSVQDFIFSTLKEACHGVYSKNKDVSEDIHAFCDHEVKASVSDMNDFIYSKLQPKALYHPRNYTGNGVTKEVKLGSFKGVICRTVLSLVEFLLVDHETVIANASTGLCNLIPLPNFQSQCAELVNEFVLNLITDLQIEVTPAGICNAIIPGQ